MLVCTIGFQWNTWIHALVTAINLNFLSKTHFDLLLPSFQNPSSSSIRKPNYPITQLNFWSRNPLSSSSSSSSSSIPLAQFSIWIFVHTPPLCSSSTSSSSFSSVIPNTHLPFLVLDFYVKEKNSISSGITIKSRNPNSRLKEIKRTVKENSEYPFPIHKKKSFQKEIPDTHFLNLNRKQSWVE